MKNKTQISFAILPFLIFACDNTEITSGKLELKAYSNICSQVRFEYDDNLLVGFTQSFGPRLAVVGTLFYEEGQLTRVETTSDYGGTSKTKLEYNKGLLSKEIITVDIESSDFENHYIQTTSFEYDKNGLLRSSTLSQDIEGFLPFKTEYEWSMGNIVKMAYGIIDQKGNFLPMGNKVLTHDGGRNYTNHNIAFVYANSLTIEAVLSRNNIVSISDDLLNDDQDIIIQRTNNYTYNVFGYPVENDIKSIFIIGLQVDKLTYE